jgi:glyoxylase-like metal-dependent hydrolase (beta-lactamase superfamily II)
MRRAITSLILACGLALAVGSSAGAQRRPANIYEVYAVRFGGFHAYPTAELVAGADTARRQELAFVVLVMKSGHGRNVLFDAGFYRPQFVDKWKPFDFVKPSVAIAKVGLKPEDVTDVVISHVHWDHLDGADLFPKATVWIQRDEYEHYVDSAGLPRDRGIDTVDAAMLASLKRAGRLKLIDGDNKEFIPGITAYTGGRHTYASEYLGVKSKGGVVILASDNVYLYENLDKHVPIHATFTPADSTANLLAQERMEHLAANSGLIIPGHDPQIFVRYPKPGDGVARIE